MAMPTKEQLEWIQASVEEYVARKKKHEVEKRQKMRRVPREVYYVDMEHLTPVGGGLYVRKTEDGGLELYEEEMTDNAMIWKCRNCGSEWLIDEVGDDWEENGCPGCPPEEDEISFD